jgi:hypothetical protein
MLARDDAPRSATTLLRDQGDPATSLGQAAQRYVDALYVAAEDVVGRDVVEVLDASADRVAADLSQEPAWPALRAHLLLLGAQGANPLEHLRAAANQRELDTAADKAAVIDWRLDNTGLRNAGRGPLPWLPAVPEALGAHEQWGQYLVARSARVADLAGQVRAAAEAEPGQSPELARQCGGRLPAGVLGDVAVWRSAMQVDPADRRPTGTPAMSKAAAIWQRNLDRRLVGEGTPALQEWGELIQRAAPDVHSDDFAPLLAERLAAMSRAGVDARGLLTAHIAAGTLPVDHAAAALWWRISRHLSPAVAEQINADHTLTTPWTPRLEAASGPPQERWAPLAAELDTRLVRQGDSSALASLMHDAHSRGHDVSAAARTLVAKEPLGELPAQDLRYRLVARLDLNLDEPPQVPSPSDSSTGKAQERKQTSPAAAPPPGRRH